MVSMRGAAFAAGAAGLALFLGGILWATLAGPDASCPHELGLSKLACEQRNYGNLLTWVMVVVGAGLVLEAAAVAMLVLHLQRRAPAPPARAGRPPAARPPPPPGTGTAPPRNRFLEPPVPPRGGSRP